MKILTFDDKPDVNFFIEDFFEEHDVETCTNCSRVLQMLKDDNFDCYIVDLNSNVSGLKEELGKKTENGLLTGWFLLTEHIWKHDLDGINKTIIFSDYNTQLRRYLDSDKTSKDEKNQFNKLENYKRVVSKSEGIRALKNAIDSIRK